MNWSVGFGKIMLKHINPLHSFSFSLLCFYLDLGLKWNLAQKIPTDVIVVGVCDLRCGNLKSEPRSSGIAQGALNVTSTEGMASLLSGHSKSMCFSSTVVWCAFMLLHRGYCQSENLSCQLGDSVFAIFVKKMSNMPPVFMFTE